MGVNSQYNQLIERLDQFIRRYYTNEMLRGAIFSLLYISLYFLLINLLEYKFYFSPTIRKILFYSFIFSSILFVYTFFINPLLKFYRLGKIISHETAAQIIGNHFTHVKDKLINILQLNKLASLDDYHLINASINQKIDDLKTVSFAKAVDLNKNKKYLQFLLIPFLFMTIVVFFAPKVITEGAKRLYFNDTVFEKEAPFQFVVNNKNLQCNQGDNFKLEVTTEGEALPADVFLKSDKNFIKLKKVDKNLFEYEFVNLQSDVKFYLSSNDFNSKEYKIAVTPKPAILAFDIIANYPPYTGKANETINSTGDITVPQGTSLTWKFYTKNTDAMQLIFGEKIIDLTKVDESFSFKNTAANSLPYTVKYKNKFSTYPDSINYSLNVIPDLYPTIQVSQSRDSLNDRFFYYMGEIGDDYGLKKLTFNYTIHDDQDKLLSSKAVDVPFNPGQLSRFTYYWNIKDFELQPGFKMNYYFEVWDNDGVHGSKSTKSALMQFSNPSTTELNKETDQANSAIKKDLSENIKDAKSLQQELKEMQDKLLEKKNLSWEDKKNLNDLLDKQKNLEKEMKELKEKLTQNFDKQKDYKDLSQNILEKQDKLKDLFNNVLNDEMKKMFEKLEKMMEELSKKDAVKKMSDLQMSNEKIEKELDRMLELFKKLEFEQKLNQSIENLEKLAEKQEELAKKTEEGADAKSLEKEQKDLNKKTDDAMKEMADLKKQNEDTKDSEDMKEAEKAGDEAQQDQQDAQNNLSKDNKKQASGKQKSAASKLSKASKKLADMKNKMQEEEESEDLQATRQLLKNILKLSFDQENLMKEIKVTNINNPKFVDLLKRQQNIKENSLMVEDSLFALAKRVFQLKTFVTKQMTDINKNLVKSISELEERNVYHATGSQQFVMTGYNNLALMLNESLQQQQQQKSSSEPKDGQPKNCSKCKNPGNGKPSLSKIQKQLNDKISKLGEQMKKEGDQQKPGGQNPSSRNTMSKEFAQMAAQQAEMKRQIEQMAQDAASKGKPLNGNLADAIKEMDKTETDLVNKRITNELLNRQQKIMVKLLEAEKAQKEQDEQKERESKSATVVERKLPPSLENYLKQKQSEVDLYKTLPPTLKPVYKSITENYFKYIAK